MSSSLCELIHSCGDVLLLLSVWHGTCSTEIPLVQFVMTRGHKLNMYHYSYPTKCDGLKIVHMVYIYVDTDHDTEYY